MQIENREIGGYLSLEMHKGEHYHQDCYTLNTVRNAIELICLAKEYKLIYIPYYLCHSISDMLEKINLPYRYYSIDRTLEPIIDFDVKDEEAVIVVNYFGCLTEAKQKRLKTKFNNLIIDNTQSFFQDAVEKIDTVYTCRKYFGVSDGAYLSANLALDFYEDLPMDHSSQRMQHLLGRIEEGATKYYSSFQENDSDLAHESIKKMSLLTESLMKSIDYNYVKEIRTQNYTSLDLTLSSINELTVHGEQGLFMYPLLIERGTQLKKHLIANKIYVPTLWPNVLQNAPERSWERYLANHLVLLPIDQRYGAEEMSLILNTIKEYQNNS